MLEALLSGFCVGIGICVIIFVGQGLFALGYGKVGMAAIKKIGKTNQQKGVQMLLGLLAVLWIVAIAFAVFGDDPTVWILVAVLPIPYGIWLFCARKRIPKLQEAAQRAEEAAKAAAERVAAEEATARAAIEATKAEATIPVTPVSTTTKLSGAAAGVGSLRDVVSFALKYSSAEGMRKYLASAANRTEDEEVQNTLNHILSVSDDQLRTAAEQAIATE